VPDVPGGGKTAHRPGTHAGAGQARGDGPRPGAIVRLKPCRRM
jgi:hypothetical protein